MKIAPNENSSKKKKLQRKEAAFSQPLHLIMLYMGHK
jgi:hypothetical protein